MDDGMILIFQAAFACCVSDKRQLVNEKINEIINHFVLMIYLLLLSVQHANQHEEENSINIHPNFQTLVICQEININLIL